MEIDSFLEYLQDVKRYSPHTLAAYAKDLNQFVEFCEKIELIGEWKEVTPKMVRRFEAGLMTGGLEFGEGEHARRPKAMTARSVCRKLSSIRSLFGYLMREGIVEDDPVELVLPPKIGKKLPVFVPTDEMDELLKKKFNPNDFSMLRDFMILEVAYCTGMRRAELVGLKVEDADMSGKVFRITGKGNKQRLVPLSCAHAGRDAGRHGAVPEKAGSHRQSARQALLLFHYGRGGSCQRAVHLPPREEMPGSRARAVQTKHPRAAAFFRHRPAEQRGEYRGDTQVAGTFQPRRHAGVHAQFIREPEASI